LHEGLLQAMQRGAELGSSGRHQLLEPIITQTFDFDTIGRIVLGSHWSTLTPEQQRTFIDRFTVLTIATYTDNFSAFNGESFTTNGSERQANSIIVHTEMHTGDETIRFDYVLRGQQQQWRIVNVLAQGVSDIALKRADYGAVVDNQGFEFLLGKLDEKIKQLATDD
jgi:phospholipid transport system substrate-binding protein